MSSIEKLLSSNKMQYLAGLATPWIAAYDTNSNVDFCRTIVFVAAVLMIADVCFGVAFLANVLIA